jgi:hypothetical protein
MQFTHCTMIRRFGTNAWRLARWWRQSSTHCFCSSCDASLSSCRPCQIQKRTRHQQLRQLMHTATVYIVCLHSVESAYALSRTARCCRLDMHTAAAHYTLVKVRVCVYAAFSTLLSITIVHSRDSTWSLQSTSSTWHPSAAISLQLSHVCLHSDRWNGSPK